MNNLGNNNRNHPATHKKQGVDERFEQNAGVRIHKGKESYGGGSGFYSNKAKLNCPNVNDDTNNDLHSNDQCK